MYTKSENSQALQSKQMLTDALLLLMKIYPFEEITITQICQEAQVVRQTFYRNFESKTDILEFYFDNMFRIFMESYSDSRINLYQKLKNFFEYLLPHKEFLILIEKNNLFFLLNKSLSINITKYSYLSEFVEIMKEPKLNIYVLGFITSTICSIISLWVKNDFEESSEKLAKLVKAFFLTLEMPVNLENVGLNTVTKT